MFDSILNKYDPKDIRSHVILRFFVDDLDENVKIEFIDSIFKKGSWTLPTEISKTSNSIPLKENTKKKFHQILRVWVEERIKYSSKISVQTKNPLVTIDLTKELREILLSIRNLNFSPEIMIVLKSFFEESNSLYLKNFFRNSLSVVIEEYNENEIETFFFYFSDKFDSKISNSYCEFIYTFLNKLAFSYKIHELSDSFLNQLSKLSISLKKNNFKSNHKILISILLIDLIQEKKLDLSNSRHNELISQTISELEKSDYRNLDFFRFLKQFNYSFKNFNFNVEIEYLFERLKRNISILENCNETYKRDIFHHYLKFSNDYFESLLFFLENINEEEAEINFVKFVNLIDELRNSFDSLIWFDEFLNFKIINGEIYNTTSKGFEVKIEESAFNNNITTKKLESIINENFISHYGFGFLHESSLSIHKSNLLNDFFNNKKTNDNVLIENEINNFYILNLNYSSTFKGKAIQLFPERKTINKILSKYELKAFFISIEIFLIEHAHKYLKSESPFLKKTDQFKILIPPDFVYNYNIDFSESRFWKILKEIRPNLYHSLYVTHKKNEEIFKKIVLAYENENTLNGQIKSRTIGGMIVDIYGFEAFLPGSQIDVKPIADYDSYINRMMEFKILQINYELKNIVVSHKALFESSIELQKKEIIKQIHKGQILEGIVKNITSYGVFIDLGGFDGLIHITDLSWSRINHPTEVLELDQKLNVVILDFDDEKTRIQLGLKQLNDHPWDIFGAELKVGDKVNGKVVVIADYGSFIEVAEGVEGLIHVSEMSWSTHLRSAQDFMKVGDLVEAIVLTIDKEERKMSLGIKQMSQNPWTYINSKYPKGSKHEGIVRNFTNFGVFLELEEGIDGLVYISDLSWTTKIKHPSEFVNIGDKLEVIVLDLDVEGRKLSLSHKLTTANPWDKHEEIFGIETIHNGTITKIFNKGAIIDFGNNVNGFLPKINFKNKKIKNGKKHQFRITEFNKQQKKIVVDLNLIEEKKTILKEKISEKSKVNLINTNYKIERGNNLKKEYINKFKIGQKIIGKVVEIADYGAYINFFENLESLIKVSEMSWNSNLHYAQEFMKIGDIREAIIIDIDKANGEILSSIKLLYDNPWKFIEINYPIGSNHFGKIIKFTNFGMLISLTKDIDGFLYFDEIPISKKEILNSDYFKIGNKINVKILELDTNKRKLFLEPIINNNDSSKIKNK